MLPLLPPRHGGLALVALVVAALSTSTDALRFRLVSPDGAPSVSVSNGPARAMTQYTNPGLLSPLPYYTLDVSDAPGGNFTYKYSVGGTAEAFDRTFPDGRAETYNDFFNRKDTMLKLPSLPLAFGKTWDRGWGLTPTFDDSYIPTLFFNGEQAKIDAALTGTTGANLTLAGVFREGDPLVYPLTDWRPVGLKRKLVFGKRDFKFQLAKKVDIYGRDQFYLRSMSLDPTALREKTFATLMDAAGLPTPKSNYVRLYANQSPVGLYLLQDDPSANSFLRAEIHGQPQYKNYAAYGSLIKGEDPFHFIYAGPARSDYPEVSVYYLGNNPATNPLQNLISRWIEPLTALQPSDDAGVDKLAQDVDLEVLMKASAVEWLAGYWRGAWGESSKFVLYEDPTAQKKWIYIPANPEQSFGVGITSIQFPRTTVTEPYWSYQVYKPRPVLQKILTSGKYASGMKSIMQQLVKNTFNTNALSKRINAQAVRIRPEVDWDRGLKRLSPGVANLYTIADFDSGLNATAERVYPLNTTAHIPGVGWGISTWVEQRSTAAATDLGVTPDATATGPDPATTSPSQVQLQGHVGVLSSASDNKQQLNHIQGFVGAIMVITAGISLSGGW